MINTLYSKDISRKVSTALKAQMESGEFKKRNLSMAQPLTSAGNDSKRWKTKTDDLCRMSMPIP